MSRCMCLHACRCVDFGGTFEVDVVGHICKWEDWYRATELDGEREKTRTRKVYITRIVV